VLEIQARDRELNDMSVAHSKQKDAWVRTTRATSISMCTVCISSLCDRYGIGSAWRRWRSARVSCWSAYAAKSLSSTAFESRSQRARFMVELMCKD
jgi:hypothetical protein